MPKNEKDIFAFQDYRLFLADRYRSRKVADRRFSHRFIAERMGVSSSGWFADVVRGRIGLTPGNAVRLARLFGLKPSQADYFLTMVSHAQAMTAEEKSHYMQKLLSFREVQGDLLGKDKLEFYSRWYHSAIRELLFFHRFEGDIEALAGKLSPPIKPQEASESLQLLERLGFLEKAGKGLRSRDATLKKDPAFPSEVLSRLLKTTMELAIAALDRFPKEQRNISALTLSLSDEGFETVQEEIRAMQQRIMAVMDRDDRPTKVYQCNIQVFPLSQ